MARPARTAIALLLAAPLTGIGVWPGLVDAGAGELPAREPAAGERAVRQPGSEEPLDRVLDLYVRDGLVYYAALQSDRAGLDRYLAARRAAPAGFDGWSRERLIAFWLNSYNAIVLRTVLDRYPIRGDAPEYPANSIRQIPGAFERIAHEVAGRRVTLDEIEESVLGSFGDPRVFLALGRGAVGSARLRSEAFSAARLELQLDAAVEEFATEPHGVVLDRLGGTVRVNPVFGWREAAFVAAYADRGWAESGRSSIERAILALIEPALFPSERAFLAENSFALRYQTFDWRLNDLTGGRP